jgi:hypothetical protein
MKNPRSPANGPLERHHELRWVPGILGVIVFGIGGYLLQGTLLSWPLIVALGTFIAAVVQHYRRGR